MMKAVEVVLYMEAFCPYCNYVHKYILKDIQIRRDEINRKLRRERLPPIPPIEIRVIDINANDGSKYMQWYEWYSRKIGGRFTPIVKIGDKVFYLWGHDKPETIEKGQLSRTQLLKKQIIEELQDITRRVEKEPRFVEQIKPDFELINHKIVDRTGVIAFWR